jgi:pyridoxamine 5'-phosphate oxidase
LQRWLDDAKAAGIPEHNAMCVATVDGQGRPSARIVLLRGLDERGLRFYTSYIGRKAGELADNPNVAAVFHWAAMQRQVRIEGRASKLSEDESDAYFASRPRGHQLSAWASEQSEPIESRDLLAERYEHFEQRFEGEEVPRPHSWGGFLIEPARFEFWQGRTNRMHDRLIFARGGVDWTVSRLQP